MHAICSCRILQYLLLCDTVSYSIQPVMSLAVLVSAYKESCEQVAKQPSMIAQFSPPLIRFVYSFRVQPQSNYIVMNNCGGTIDIGVDALEPAEEKMFHRRLAPAVRRVQRLQRRPGLRLLSRPNEKEVSAYGDIFGQNNDDDDEVILNINFPFFLEINFYIV